MALSADDAARLASLQAARDDLIAGKRAAKVTSGGRSVEYAAADLSRLEREIGALNTAAAAADGLARTRGALRFRIR